VGRGKVTGLALNADGWFSHATPSAGSVVLPTPMVPVAKGLGFRRTEYEADHAHQGKRLIF